MTVQKIRFNKTTLSNLVREGRSTIIKDSLQKGLRFKVGSNRSVFQFEKRISGRKGSPITFSLGAFPAVSIEDARQEARRLATLCEKGIDPRNTDQQGETQCITFSIAVDKFFEVKKELARRTINKYRNVVKRQIPGEWLERDMNTITPKMLVERFHVSRDSRKERCWEFLKVFGNIWNTTAPFFRDGQDKRILGPNPIPEARKMLKSVKRHKPRRPVVCVNQLGQFVVGLENLISDEKRGPCYIPMWRIALLSLFTAFRFNEARCLKWEYVDLENGVIHLPGVVKGDDSFGGTKNSNDHWVALSTYPWEMLRRLNEERSTMSPYIFPSINNPNKPTIRQGPAFERVSALLGTHYSPHASRRTFASVADEAGLGFLTVKRLLNHTYEGGVTGGYIRREFNPGKERKSFQRVCDYILDRRAEYLGEKKVASQGFNEKEALGKLKRYALELGLDPNMAGKALIHQA